MSSWPHTFSTQYPSVALSWLDDQFNQLSAASTSTISLSGAALVGFKPAGTNAVASNAQAKLQERVSLKDFGCKIDGSTDDTTNFTNALKSGACLYHPGGTLVLTATCQNTSGIASSLIGAGAGISIIKAVGVTLNGNNLIDWYAADGFSIRGITFDFNSQSVTTGIEGVLGSQNCTNFDISDCEILNLTALGIAANGPRRFRFERNYITKAAAANTLNEAITVSASSQQAQDGHIVKNTCVNTGMDLNVLRCTIAYNYITNWKFGAGITVDQDSVNSLYYKIVGNVCTGGTGTDVNGTNCPGIENWGGYSYIAGNLCSSNAGSGIDQGGAYCTVVGNTCNNNGTVGGSGIVARYANATYNASNSVFCANRCNDTQGIPTQTYGYQEQSASLLYITLSGNFFDGSNVSGAQQILSTTTSIDSPTLEGASTITVGVIASGASASFGETFAGARFGDMIVCSMDKDLKGCTVSGYVNNTNAVQIIFSNNTGSSQTISAGITRYRALKPKDFIQY